MTSRDLTYECSVSMISLATRSRCSARVISFFGFAAAAAGGGDDGAWVVAAEVSDCREFRLPSAGGRASADAEGELGATRLDCAADEAAPEAGLVTTERGDDGLLITTSSPPDLEDREGKNESALRKIDFRLGEVGGESPSLCVGYCCGTPPGPDVEAAVGCGRTRADFAGGAAEGCSSGAPEVGEEAESAVGAG